MLIQVPYVQSGPRSAGSDLDRIEALGVSLPQESCPVVHRFGPGLYIREVRLPAGAFVVGHKQTQEHLNIMLKGKVRMEDGTILEAPLTFVGKPGRKCGTVIEDVVWQNVYATTETDIETLESTYLEKSDSFVAQSSPKPQDEARSDFQRMLSDLGVTAETVASQSENESDQIPMPAGSYKFQKADSGIHGKGIFACGHIAGGETIGPARIGDKRTPLGRFTNHSGEPNARMERHGRDIYLVALYPISGNKGGQHGEEITVDYRTSVEVACQA